MRPLLFVLLDASSPFALLDCLNAQSAQYTLLLFYITKIFYYKKWIRKYIVIVSQTMISEQVLYYHCQRRTSNESVIFFFSLDNHKLYLSEFTVYPSVVLRLCHLWWFQPNSQVF